MPGCESVKAMNAPTANSGINRSVIPPNTLSSNPAVAASDSYADRVDEPSTGHRERARQITVRATRRQTLGKSTKLVLADRHSTASTLPIAMK